ncbi:MAG: acyloxyacyl hydrolase [Rickettsiales bacterium]|jgi:hypothetical protein|nr:acyloxyacyl hydrolase [Rickettsiales bacterium]
MSSEQRAMSNTSTQKSHSKFLLLIAHCALLITGAAGANPMFNGAARQISVYLGQGTDGTYLYPDGHIVPFYLAHIAYSMPNTFFGLPARQNVDVAGTMGFGKTKNYAPDDAAPMAEWDWENYSDAMVYFSEDAALLSGERWWAGAGMGMGMQAHQNERIGTKLIFGLKAFVGMRVSEMWNMEIFSQHFSNGSTDLVNNSYNFFGLGATRNF